jgi:hypothetical protein
MNQSRGLGDEIRKLTNVTGIHTFVKKTTNFLSYVSGKELDCGCDGRQDKLNKMFPKTQTN